MTEIVKVLVYLGGFSAYLISGNPVFLKGLCIISLFESFSKIRLDIRQDKFKWSKSFKVLLGKLWYVAVIIVSTQLDYLLAELGLEFKKISVTNGAVLGFIIIDTTRFIKNVKGFGIPVPDILLQVLKKINEYVNKGKS